MNWLMEGDSLDLNHQLVEQVSCESQNIPSALIERVEIVPVGGAAVYGMPLQVLLIEDFQLDNMTCWNGYR